MNEIRVIFVLPEGCTRQDQATAVMLDAYEACKQNVVNVSWVEEDKFSTTDLSKTDFVVFEEFKGKNFESLNKTKCARILGPWCLLVCLNEGRPIPNFTWPIYNVAMSNCIVSCSQIPKAKKNEFRDKVQLMGGCYTDDLMSSNTHLVAGGVQSTKYLQAAESGLKLMIPDWINAVWEASQSNNVHCDDEQFAKYKCLPFHRLTISLTGFPTFEMRTEMAEKISSHGGVFTGKLVVSETDVLIVFGENGLMSKKYQVARTSPNIHCVNVDWITDSIERGYALPFNHYLVSKKGTSTPTKQDESVPNFSLISAIGDVTSRFPNVLEETVASKLVQPSFLAKRISPNKRKCSINNEVDKLVEGLDIKKAKRAGQYLDGCSVYLAGFKSDQREKLTKILNLSGATRYDDISDRLTHIIIGNTTCPEVKIIKSKNYAVSLVSLLWLLDSMEKQQALDEENYLINLHDNDDTLQLNSPLGRKGLSLLRSNKTCTPNDIEVANTSKNPQQVASDDNELIQHYSQNATSADDETDTLVRLLRNNSDFNSKPPEDSSVEMNTTSQDTNIFYSKKFIIVNFSSDDYQNLKESIENALGTVVPKTYKGIPDYAVAPTFIKSPLQISAIEVVNDMWLVQSLENSEEIAIAYYHRPFVVCDSKPLKNCVVTISGYTSGERNFLMGLIEALGGVAQEQFARISNLEKNVQASTHLVSLETEGKKYAAALRWRLPVVTKDWLFECAKSGTRVPEEKCLMADPKLSTSCQKSLTPRNQTPLSQIQPLDINKSVQTPINQRLFQGGADSSPCSQVTPIHKLMVEVRKTKLLGTPELAARPKTWNDVDTPESPFGACIRPHLSAKSKKELLKYINRLPDFVPPPEKRKSTPLSEAKRRCWKKVLNTPETLCDLPEDKTQSKNDANEQPEETSSRGKDTVDGDTQNTFINTKLKELEDMVSAFGENRRSSRNFHFQSTIPCEAGTSAEKDSQPFTVGWDYDELSHQPKQHQEEVRIFIISGVENDQRQTIVDKIESLGGQVSHLTTYDPNSTHLICPKPARNEKTLSCMAAGKWILHTSYIDKSISSGKFLHEEDFEFGNPRSKENIKTTFDKETEFKVQSIHWWRKEISRRGYGAFNDMRAIVVAQKRDPIIRVIEAGGGHIVDAKPPFGEDVHATHCLLEIRSVPDFSVYNPLAQRGILCLNTLYISEFLYRTNKDVKDAILPHFSKFYT